MPLSPALTSKRQTSRRMPEASDSNTLVAVGLSIQILCTNELSFNYTTIIEMINQTALHCKKGKREKGKGKREKGKGKKASPCKVHGEAG
jgi:hypothetical protein